MTEAAAAGNVSSGHHNHNYVASATSGAATLLGCRAGTPVTVRVPREGALPVVIRTWFDEGQILDAIQRMPHVPRRLFAGEGFAVHSYVAGIPLSSVCGNDIRVDARLVGAVAGLLAGMVQVPEHMLPPLPDIWPRDHGDSRDFLRVLAWLADRQIRQPNRARFGTLFAALGIPEDALARLAERVPAMTRRPFSLLHADVHRDNLILSYNGEPPLICVDWELATYGDPLHDLATHLVRMRYPEQQWGEVVDAWAQAMTAVRPAAVEGLGQDLRHYVAFERAQSVYPDVMRAVQALSDPADEESLGAAKASVWRALASAEEPLRLGRVPDQGEIERILAAWMAARPFPGE
ncbi:phosphotransferase [Streptomyces cadmiisoli]|uniref:phosphotransferase n=1 Tax=Streptomyces cadmiisoli TaxID=2184053 RepID=UPI0006AFC56A